MSSKDEETYRLCQEALNARLSIRELSILISTSYRQTQRIIKKVRSKGMLGVKHGNYAKTPINKTPREVEEDIRSLFKQDYYDFNSTHLREMLVQFDGSVHGWFGDVVCDFIGGLDGATGKFLGLEFFYGETIIAESSQSNGKIERLWKTLEDRLIAELRFCQITMVEEANIFLKETFIPKFNEPYRWLQKL